MCMDLKELKQRATNSTPYSMFEDSISALTERTQYNYKHWLNRFCTSLNTTPDELVKEYKQLSKSDNDAERAVLPNAWRIFNEELLDTGLNQNTVNNHLKAINKLFVSNNLPRLNVVAKRVDHKGAPIIQRHQIKELLSHCERNMRIRALIFTLRDSGLRVGDCHQLTIEDFNNAVRHERDGLEFRAWSNPLTTEKNKIKAYVCLGFESIDAIKAYIGNRTEGPIFLTIRAINGSERMVKAGAQLSPHAISRAVENLVKVVFGARNLKFTAHSFRKFYMTQWLTVGKLPLAKIIAGKRLSPTDQPYLLIAESGLHLEEYAKHYSQILANDTQNIKYLKQEEKIKDLERRLKEREADQPTPEQIAANKQALKDEILAELKQMINGVEK